MARSFAVEVTRKPPACSTVTARTSDVGKSHHLLIFPIVAAIPMIKRNTQAAPMGIAPSSEPPITMETITMPPAIIHPGLAYLESRQRNDQNCSEESQSRMRSPQNAVHQRFSFSFIDISVSQRRAPDSKWTTPARVTLRPVRPCSDAPSSLCSMQWCKDDPAIAQHEPKGIRKPVYEATSDACLNDIAHSADRSGHQDWQSDARQAWLGRQAAITCNVWFDDVLSIRQQIEDRAHGALLPFEKVDEPTSTAGHRGESPTLDIKYLRQPTPSGVKFANLGSRPPALGTLIIQFRWWFIHSSSLIERNAHLSAGLRDFSDGPNRSVVRACSAEPHS